METIRIRDYDLREEDIKRFPIWEYALDEEGIDGQDERTLKPLPETTVIDSNKGYIIVRANFYFANNTELKGFIKPKRNSSATMLSTLLPYDLFPVIVTAKGQMSFGYGSKKPDRDELEKNYRFLNLRPDEIFPIKFISDIEMINYVAEGVIEGFMYFDEDTEDFFHLTEEDIRIIR